MVENASRVFGRFALSFYIKFDEHPDSHLWGSVVLIREGIGFARGLQWFLRGTRRCRTRGRPAPLELRKKRRKKNGETNPAKKKTAKTTRRKKPFPPGVPRGYTRGTMNSGFQRMVAILLPLYHGHTTPGGGLTMP